MNLEICKFDGNGRVIAPIAKITSGHDEEYAYTVEQLERMKENAEKLKKEYSKPYEFTLLEQLESNFDEPVYTVADCERKLREQEMQNALQWLILNVLEG